MRHQISLSWAASSVGSSAWPSWVKQPAFALDAAATDYSVSVADSCITEEMDALSVQNWFDLVTDQHKLFPVAWCNPPFSQKKAFLQKAFEQSVNGFIMMMLPFAPATGWWRSLVTHRATTVFVPDGRYNFLNPVTGEIAPGSKFPTCFVLFSPLSQVCQWVEFERTDEKKLRNWLKANSLWFTIKPSKQT